MISKSNKKFCVYEHVFPNGKRYIGITSKKPEARWENGSGYSKELYLVAEYAIRDYIKMSPRTNKYKFSEKSKFIFLNEVAERDKAFFVEED